MLVAIYTGWSSMNRQRSGRPRDPMGCFVPVAIHEGIIIDGYAYLLLVLIPVIGIEGQSGVNSDTPGR